MRTACCRAGSPTRCSRSVSYGHGREFWRAYGLILAWPLNVYNIFTHQPLWWWIAIGFVADLRADPARDLLLRQGRLLRMDLLVRGAGRDARRHASPQDAARSGLEPRSTSPARSCSRSRSLLLVVRVAGWALPAGNSGATLLRGPLAERLQVDRRRVRWPACSATALYFWYSGRVWCRFFCPLAALMHVVRALQPLSRSSPTRRSASRAACAPSVCHQGIDVMSFANQGAPMQDPECVRCSACVTACPTGVLTLRTA